MKYCLSSFIALLYCASIGLAAPELTGTPQELIGYLQDIPSTVSIAGTAEKKCPADRAIIHLTVTTEEKSMSGALEKNRIVRQEIITRLLAAGIAKERIEAAQFSSTPESGLFTDKIRRYKVENALKATVTNEAEFRAVAELIDSRDEIFYQRTEFELADRKALEQLVLADACRDAVAKKHLYETELDVQLTPVRFHDGRILLNKPRLQMDRAKAIGFSAETAPTAPPPVQFDEIEINATVTVEYRLSAQ